MDLHEVLTSAESRAILYARVDVLCKERTIGESLNLSMLYTLLEALESDDGVFTDDVAAIHKDQLHINALLYVVSPPPPTHSCHHMAMLARRRLPIWKTCAASTCGNEHMASNYSLRKLVCQSKRRFWSR